MDNVKLEELLSKIISEDDNDEEICMMVEECKKEDEEKKKSILTTNMAIDAYIKYTTEDRPYIYTNQDRIIYEYPDGREFVIDTSNNDNLTAMYAGYAATASSGISGPAAIANMAINTNWVPYYR